MIKYFKHNDLLQFTKGFDSNWLDEPKCITGECTEITEEEYIAEIPYQLNVSELEYGAYEVQEYERAEYDEDGEWIKSTSFYVPVRFVKSL